MSALTPSTITVTGLDGGLNETLSNMISTLLKREGFRAIVRVEAAATPHHYNFDHPGQYQTDIDSSLIQLTGAYTVSEIDAISFKLRGGR